MKCKMSRVGLFSGLFSELIGASLVALVCVVLGDPEHTARTAFYILVISYILSPIFISFGIDLSGRALKQSVGIRGMLWPLYKFTLILTPAVAILALLIFFLEELIYEGKGWGEYGLDYFGKPLFIILILITALLLVSYGVKCYKKIIDKQTINESSGALHNSTEHVE